ncbi:MAG: hypothetical protein R2729_13050 [Bryobacteraceae bacterium]
MAFVVRAFPLVKPIEDIRKFAADLAGERSTNMGGFYREYGVKAESWYLQETPAGPWVICATQVADPNEASGRYAQASEDFHGWFKAQVMHLTGVNPSEAPLGPPTELLFAWDDQTPD